jgi:ABC-type uncharacterized transport system substrate-binding protein
MNPHVNLEFGPKTEFDETDNDELTIFESLANTEITEKVHHIQNQLDRVSDNLYRQNDIIFSMHDKLISMEKNMLLLKSENKKIGRAISVQS